MKITNYNNQYVKVQSKYLDELLSDPSGYSSLYLEGKSGCSATLYSGVIGVGAATTNTWTVDLDTVVKLENTVYQLFIKNLFSGKEFNCITAPIDLGYVADTCTSIENDCTLQLYSAVMAIQFKDQIDLWFAGRDIVSNVTVSFSGNKMHVQNIPANFGLSKIGHNQTNVQPYQLIDFGFVNTAQFILVEDGILVKPEFFSVTALVNGIYTIKVKLTKAVNAGLVEESMCALIDIDLKCKVAQYIKTISEGIFSDDANSAMLLHYALVNASNCGCNCTDLCTVYNELMTLVDGSPIVDPSINDCGC